MTENLIVLLLDDFVKALQGKDVFDIFGDKHNFLRQSNIDKKLEVAINNALVIGKYAELDKIFKEHEEFFISRLPDLAEHLQKSETTDPSSNKTRETSLIFDYPIIIESGSFYEMVLKQTVFNASFEIRGGIFNNGIVIDKCRFNDGFKIHADLDSFLLMANNHFCCFKNDEDSTSFEIVDTNLHTAIIENNHFDGLNPCGLYDTCCGGHIYIYDNKFSTNLAIINCEFSDDCKIKGNTFQKDFAIENSIFDKLLDVLDSDVKGCLNIEVENIKMLRIGNFKSPASTIQNLMIYPLTFITNQIIIQRNTRIINLRLKRGIAPTGSLYIHPCKIQELTLDDFINKGDLEVTGVVPESQTDKTKLKLVNSNLGNAIFKSVNFDSFDKIIVKSSKLNNISTINKHLPTTLKPAYATDSQGNRQYQTPSEMAETYNQLYLAMQKQGNRAKEMEYYSQYLHWQHKAYLQQRKLSVLVSLTLHKWSTNFGQNWIQGLVLFIVIGSMLCYIYIQQLIPDPLVKNSLLQSKNFDPAKYYLQFLNPIRKGKLIPWAQLTTTMVAIDSLWRLIAAYLTYQVVTATRRFGQK